MRPLAYLASWSMVALVALIALGEIDRLISGALSCTRDGFDCGPVGHSLNAAIGPFAFEQREAFPGWGSSALHGDVVTWLIVSVVIDFVFIAAYVAVLLPLLRRGIDEAGNYPVAAYLLGILVLVELFEAVALLAGAAMLNVPRPVEFALETIGWIVVAAATAKWVVTALLVVALLRNRLTRGVLGWVFQRLVQGLWLHRLSAVLLILLFALACIPSDGILDQLPDIQRQWLGEEFQGWHILFAFATMTLASLAAFVLGRNRTRRAIAAHVLGVPQMKDELRRTLLWWLIPPIAWLVLAALAGVTAWINDGWKAIPGAFGWEWTAFLGVTVIVLGTSFIARSGEWNREVERDHWRARYAWIVGDLLAVLVLAIGGLGLVRSMTAPVFLGPGGSLEGWPWAGALLLWLGGAAVAVAAPQMLRWLAPGASRPRWLARLRSAQDPTAMRTPELPDEWRSYRHWLAGILIASMVLLLIIALIPTFMALVLGPVALTVLAITAWTTALGAFTVALQEYRPLAVFRWMRLTATPVLTLGLTIPLISGAIIPTFGGDTGIHAVRQIDSAGSGSDAAGMPGLRTRLNEIDCPVQIGEQTVQPVLLVVAEGGGIRAAYWTGRALEILNSGDGCLGGSILASSGVSGGSVGLAVTATRGEGTITEQLQKLATPETVGSGVAGLLVGDAIATALGVHVPSLIHDEGFIWRDRAALIESGWTEDATGLGDQYDPMPSERTGFLVMNSTDTNTKCRILVGPNVFPRTVTSDAGCDLSTDQPAASRWLGRQCQRSLSWASAAMLSARFPIITPAGRMPDAPGCPDSVQLIDGGYAEGSGLGTMADLAPSIAAALRSRNAVVGSGGPFYVPIIVYLRNSAGFDVAEELKDITAEPLVPLMGMAAKAEQAAEAAWMQRLASTLRSSCPASGQCNAAQQEVREAFGNGIVVVAPSTRPAVVPPLGWALSAHSIESLERSLKTEAEECAGTEPEADAPFARLCHLVGLDSADD